MVSATGCPRWAVSVSPMPTVRPPDFASKGQLTDEIAGDSEDTSAAKPVQDAVVAPHGVDVGLLIFARPEVRSRSRRIGIVRVRIRGCDDPEAPALAKHRIPQSADDRRHLIEAAERVCARRGCSCRATRRVGRCRPVF